jgi:oxaloacetate decarboxylase alpha subunit/pyruvate carboxylase subunit B
MVKVGDKVKAGDIVIMLEAMKMENAIPAPTAGTIKAVNFAAGSAVKKGEVLAIISTK